MRRSLAVPPSRPARLTLCSHPFRRSDPMKARMYWSYATRSLARGGQRSLLAIFCVAVGVMAIVSLQLVGNAIDTALTGDIRALNGGDLSIAATTAPLTTNQLGAFDTLQAQGALTAYTAVESVSGQTRTATGARRFFTVNAVDPARFPLAGAANFTDPRGAKIGRASCRERVQISEVRDAVQKNKE